MTQQYCHIENEKIDVLPKKLPKNWRNISGLSLATNESLREKGWLPAELVVPVFNEETQKLGKDKYEIKEDRVIVTTEILDMLVEEIEVKKQYKATEYQRLREAEYPEINEMVVALWESVVENRPEQATALQKKRVEIKTKYPKPDLKVE